MGSGFAAPRKKKGEVGFYLDRTRARREGQQEADLEGKRGTSKQKEREREQCSTTGERGSGRVAKIKSEGTRKA